MNTGVSLLLSPIPILLNGLYSIIIITVIWQWHSFETISCALDMPQNQSLHFTTFLHFLPQWHFSRLAFSPTNSLTSGGS